MEGCFKSLPPHKVIPCNPAPPFCCQNNFVCCRLLPPIVYTRSLEGTNNLFGKGTRKSLSFLPGQPTMSKILRIYSNFHNGDFFLMGFIFSGVSCSCELLRGFAHWYLNVYLRHTRPTASSCCALRKSKMRSNAYSVKPAQSAICN